MSAPYYVDDSVTLHHGDCLDVLATLPDASIDAVVTDPPYGLEFMGREWDSFGGDLRQVNDPTFHPSDATTPFGGVRHGGGASYRSNTGDTMRAFQAWCEQWAAECLRVLRPGGHLLAFGGTRTWHRLTCAVEDAGFEIRDSIAWLYGSGFPKSLDVSKAIDKAAGAQRTKTQTAMGPTGNKYARGLGDDRPWMAEAAERGFHEHDSHEPATAAAAAWSGWGTALKPAHEPIVVGRKSLVGTVAANVLEHGTGALNVDGCRVGDDERQTTRSTGELVSGNGSMAGGNYARTEGPIVTGRWPANVVLDESQAAELDRQSGATVSRVGQPRGAANGDGWGMTATGAEYDDQGGASRFFPTFRYEPKAPTAERPRDGAIAHPTVKPLDLMRWLVRLVTPPGGTVLEPFAGSGTTAEACVIEGFRCIAIEREADYLPLIVARLSKPIQVGLDFGGDVA